MVSGPFGNRPYVALSPGSPQKAAGMRIEPPPSPPVAIVTSPPATAAAAPPDDPPGVRSTPHGLRVMPCGRARVVEPGELAHRRLAEQDRTGLAQPGDDRGIEAELPSFSGIDAWLFGQPATGVPSLIGNGTPPKGKDTSADFAAARRRVDVEVAERVELRRVDGGQRGVELVDRRSLAASERIDQRDGVPTQGSTAVMDRHPTSGFLRRRSPPGGCRCTEPITSSCGLRSAPAGSRPPRRRSPPGGCRCTEPRHVLAASAPLRPVHDRCAAGPRPAAAVARSRVTRLAASSEGRLAGTLLDGVCRRAAGRAPARPRAVW